MLFEALRLVFDPYVLWVIFASAAFGLFVGAVPGLTATMATALLVPVTFFMEPVPAIASIVTATAMAIFAGDIPSCLLRMPGTPASAAYTDEAYAMTKKGQGELALGSGLWFSMLGGLFGTAELAGGLTLIPIMIGMFAVSEILRSVSRIAEPWEMAQAKIGNVLHGMWTLTKRHPWQFFRGSVVGTAIGALPGAGADIAAWMSYAVSKRFAKEREKFGTGHVEGIIEAGASNNSALAGAWIPALVFGIPGDSITAIVIGVLYMKNLNPGPTIFMNNAASIYAVFLVFILANLLMIPLGIVAIKGAKQMLRAPRAVLMPVILLFCVVGSFAINNSMFGVVLMLVFGLVAYVMEENGFPVAPAILGMVLGAMLEENFISSMIKAEGNFVAFFERPIAGALGVLTLGVLSIPLARR